MEIDIEDLGKYIDSLIKLSEQEKTTIKDNLHEPAVREMVIDLKKTSDADDADCEQKAKNLLKHLEEEVVDESPKD